MPIIKEIEFTIEDYCRAISAGDDYMRRSDDIIYIRPRKYDPTDFDWESLVRDELSDIIRESGIQDDSQPALKNSYEILISSFRKNYVAPFHKAMQDQVLTKFFYNKNGSPRHTVARLAELYLRSAENKDKYINLSLEKIDYEHLVIDIMEYAFIDDSAVFTKLYEALEKVQETPPHSDSEYVKKFTNSFNSTD